MALLVIERLCSTAWVFGWFCWEDVALVDEGNVYWIDSVSSAVLGEKQKHNGVFFGLGPLIIKEK